MKLSKRMRHWIKWNGPKSANKKVRRQNKANLGKGSVMVRDIAYFYECRYRMMEPCSEARFCSGQRPSAKRKGG